MLKILSIIVLLPRLATAQLPSGWVIGWGDNSYGVTTGVAPFNGQNEIKRNDAAGVVIVEGQVLRDVVSISCGKEHALALKKDGTVVSWGGNNTCGELSVPKGLSNVVAVAAGVGLSLALKKDGTVISWGGCGQIVQPTDLTNVVKISAGCLQALAIRKDGDVTSWGAHGRKTPEGLTNIVDICAGGFPGRRNLAIKQDSTIIHWGSETSQHDATPPKELTNILSVAIGRNHSLALQKNGTVFGWGFNEVGQATGVKTTNDSLLSAGLVAIGKTTLSNIVQIAAHNDFNLALKNDGTIVGWGQKLSPQNNIPIGLSGVVAVGVGDRFCLAITTNRAVADKFPNSNR
jgi:alpha-tubulin suppressor-like RCC1 family protein